MKHMSIKLLPILLSSALLVSCGGGKDEDEFKFYTLKEAGAQQLELTVEASGTVEAISSIEIKSKASGQVLFLGAEVGDYVEEGIVLARIDQRTPTNTLAQANADLEVAKVRLSNAQNQFATAKLLCNKLAGPVRTGRVANCDRAPSRRHIVVVIARCG